MVEETDVRALVDEYQSVFSNISSRRGDAELCRVLEKECEWKKEGAEAVLYLARTYGSFVLRNALAVAVSLGIEDGKAGL
jgi:hypothetical protein